MGNTCKSSCMVIDPASASTDSSLIEKAWKVILWQYPSVIDLKVNDKNFLTGY